MERLFGTTTVINEAASTAKKRSFLKITLIFLLIYFIGAMLSTALLLIPTYIYLFNNDDFVSLVANPTMDYDRMYDELDNILSNLPEWFDVFSLISTVGMIIAVVIYCTRFERRRFFTLGFIKKGAVKEYSAGLVIGLIMFAAAYGIILLSGQFEFSGVKNEISIPVILFFFFGYVIQGMSEEVLLRGFYFVSSANGSSVPIAVFASSIFFSLLHLGNNGVSIMGLVNIFLFGVFAALYFLRRGSIWGIGAIHTIWNFAQGNIFGCGVSGNQSSVSVFETVQNESNGLFNGGAFGPEGGLGVTIILFIGIVILLFMKNKEIRPEINFEKEFFSA